MASSKTLDLRKDEVYYGNEANWQYMSVSQYKDFTKCEAAALAKLKGDWEPISDPQALLVGNYVHSYFESKEAHERFKQENSDKLHKKNGELYKAFEIAEQMIKRIEREPFFQFLWQGEKEVPITGNLFGVEWKGKIDLLNVEKGYFVDLKTSRGFDVRYWDNDRNRYVSFVESFGYVVQIAIYEKLLKQKYGKSFEGFIFAVSKETPPNVEAINIEQPEKDFDIGLVEQRVNRVEQVKTGQLEPVMCGKCEYCREHKKLEGFIFPGQLIEE